MSILKSFSIKFLLSYFLLIIFRTKALVLDMLSAIVTLTDGHELVLGAFNKFRSAYNEVF